MPLNATDLNVLQGSCCKMFILLSWNCFLWFILEFILSLAFTEECWPHFSAVSVLYNFHAVFKVNLNELFWIHYVMLSIGAGNNLFHSVRISGEGNFRMNYFLFKFFVGLANSLEPYGFQQFFHRFLHHFLEYSFHRFRYLPENIFLKPTKDFAWPESGSLVWWT